MTDTEDEVSETSSLPLQDGTTGDAGARKSLLRETLAILSKEGRRTKRDLALNNLNRWEGQANQEEVPDGIHTIVLEGDWASAATEHSRTTGQLVSILNITEGYQIGGGYRSGCHNHENDMITRTDIHFHFPKRELYTDDEMWELSGKGGNITIWNEEVSIICRGCINQDPFSSAWLPDEGITPFIELRTTPFGSLGPHTDPAIISDWVKSVLHTCSTKGTNTLIFPIDALSLIDDEEKDILYAISDGLTRRDNPVHTVILATEDTRLLDNLRQHQQLREKPETDGHRATSTQIDDTHLETNFVPPRYSGGLTSLISSLTDPEQTRVELRRNIKCLWRTKLWIPDKALDRCRRILGMAAWEGFTTVSGGKDLPGELVELRKDITPFINCWLPTTRHCLRRLPTPLAGFSALMSTIVREDDIYSTRGIPILSPCSIGHTTCKRKQQRESGPGWLEGDIEGINVRKPSPEDTLALLYQPPLDWETEGWSFLTLVKWNRPPTQYGPDTCISMEDVQTSKRYGTSILLLERSKDSYSRATGSRKTFINNLWSPIKKGPIRTSFTGDSCIFRFYPPNRSTITALFPHSTNGDITNMVDYPFIISQSHNSLDKYFRCPFFHHHPGKRHTHPRTWVAINYSDESFPIGPDGKPKGNEFKIPIYKTTIFETFIVHMANEILFFALEEKGKTCLTPDKRSDGFGSYSDSQWRYLEETEGTHEGKCIIRCKFLCLKKVEYGNAGPTPRNETGRISYSFLKGGLHCCIRLKGDRSIYGRDPWRDSSTVIDVFGKFDEIMANMLHSIGMAAVSADPGRDGTHQNVKGRIESRWLPVEQTSGYLTGTSGSTERNKGPAEQTFPFIENHIRMPADTDNKTSGCIMDAIRRQEIERVYPTKTNDGEILVLGSGPDTPPLLTVEETKAEIRKQKFKGTEAGPPDVEISKLQDPDPPKTATKRKPSPQRPKTPDRKVDNGDREFDMLTSILNYYGTPKGPGKGGIEKGGPVVHKGATTKAHGKGKPVGFKGANKGPNEPNKDGPNLRSSTRCRFFNSAKPDSCKRGATCRFLH